MLAALATFLVASSTTTASPSAWQWRVSAGGEINSDSHGVLNAGLRNGPLELQLFTDTLELRLSESLPDHRWWIAARAQAGTAEMLFAPWTAGGPDPTRSLGAVYFGLEAGSVAYLPHGFYAGVECVARRYSFSLHDSTLIAKPEPALVVGPSARLGWWQPEAELSILAGADVQLHGTAPRLRLSGQLHPSWVLAPRLSIWAGLAQHEDALTLTRLGGLNPYVVPLAGAAWAELWVENYAVARVGAALRLSFGELMVFSDLAHYDGHNSYGLGTALHVGLDDFFGDLAFGWAPELERQPGILRISVWLEAGLRWSAL